MFAGVGSFSAAVTVAVFETTPAPAGIWMVNVIVALPPLFSAPREQITVVVPLQTPCVVCADTNVVPAGRMSVTVTADAPVGPLFVTTMV